LNADVLIRFGIAEVVELSVAVVVGVLETSNKKY
jgi:hypothetical protein